jgi:methionine-rich copper-binding protein CopC
METGETWKWRKGAHMKSTPSTLLAVFFLMALVAVPLVHAHTKLEKSEPKEGAMLTEPPAHVQKGEISFMVHAH